MPVAPKTDTPVVAIFNASQDTVDFLVAFFGQHGFRAFGRTWPAHEPLSPDVAVGFISQHRPHVIIFDVSLPYEANWQRFREFQDLGDQWRVPVVLTTTNTRALKDCIGSTDAFEIVGKPYDLEQLLTCVKQALTAP